MFCFFKVPFFVFLGMVSFVLLAGTIVFMFGSCDSGKLSYGDSLYFSFITFFTVGFGDITLKTGFGKLLSAIIGGSGVLSMGIFVTTLYSSVITYKSFLGAIPSDKNTLRVLAEINQDFDNVFGNYGLKHPNKPFDNWTKENLETVKDKVFDSFIRTNVPDLGSNYHSNGINAFLRNAELIDHKIKDLVAIDFDSNFKSDVKKLAYFSRNLVNDFHWNFFKKTNMKANNRSFTDNVLIVGEDRSKSLVMKYLEVNKEVRELRLKIYKHLKVYGEV